MDKSTREVIKSSERLEAMGWGDYLERQCVKMEANFIEYRPETGSWVFKVKKASESIFSCIKFHFCITDIFDWFWFFFLIEAV